MTIKGNTERRNWRGETIRDGEHAKKCPSLNCDRCVNAKSKKPFIRTARRSFKHSLRLDNIDNI